MNVVCTNCEKEFDKALKDIKRTKTHFCSKDCYQEFHTRKVEIQCRNCEKLIFKKPSALSRVANSFCSRSCAIGYNNKKRVGENHPLFKNADYRVKAFSYFSAECVLCKYNIKEVLEVHHKDYDRTNNAIENLVILCRNCHCEVHLGLRSVS